MTVTLRAAWAGAAGPVTGETASAPPISPLRTVRLRRTGRPRSVILGYFEDGPNLVTLATNGWGEPEPAWWLNLRADPDVSVVLVDGPRQVRAHAATGDERSRLWARWCEIDKNFDALAARRPSGTAVVVLEPRPVTAGS